MAEVLRPLSNGKMMLFDDAVTSPEEMQQAVILMNNKIDLDNDSTGETVDKSIRTLARGTGEGIASTLDLPDVAGQWLGEVGRNLWEEGHGRPYERKSAQWPITDFYNEKIAAPVQPGYERMNDITAMIAPAIIETAATMGAGGPAAIAQMGARQGLRGAAKTAKQMAGAGSRSVARAATTTGVGVGGGYLGGEAGELIGGETGKEIGGFLGGLLAGGVSPTIKGTLKSMFFDPDSKETLDAINRLNAETGANIPVTSGILSPKRLGAKEDQLARQPIIGQKVLETRRGQYEGIDKALQNVMERIRGRPAGGPITRESIGSDIKTMLNDTQTTIGDKISNMQEVLANRVGLLTDTDAMEIDRTLKSLVENETLGADLNAEAEALRSSIRRNYKLPKDDIDPDSMDVPTPVMRYGATKQTRSRLGKQIPGQTLDKQVTAPAYESMTDMMGDAAERKGIPRQEFDDVQAETKRLADQRDAVSDLQTSQHGPEGGAYSALFGGNSRGSVQHLEPIREHQPLALNEMLADALELDTRGKNAGKKSDPELFNPKDVGDKWRDRSPDFRRFYTDSSPDARPLLDDISTVAQAETSRAGKRSVPGGPGSTIGEGQNPKGGLSALVANAIGGPLASIATLGMLPAYRQVKSNFLTNEGANQRLFQKEPLSTSIARSGAGAAINAVPEADNMRIDDPGSETHGQRVTLAPDQSDVPPTMKRVITPDGRKIVIGNRLIGLE